MAKEFQDNDPATIETYTVPHRLQSPATNDNNCEGGVKRKTTFGGLMLPGCRLYFLFLFFSLISIIDFFLRGNKKLKKKKGKRTKIIKGNDSNYLIRPLKTTGNSGPGNHFGIPSSALRSH